MIKESARKDDTQPARGLTVADLTKQLEIGCQVINMAPLGDSVLVILQYPEKQASPRVT